MYYIGADCSGTKTVMILCDENGKQLNSISGEPALYDEKSMHDVVASLNETLSSLLKNTDIECKACSAAFCMSCAEQNLQLDTQFERQMSSRFAHFNLTNDGIAAYNAAFGTDNCLGIVLIASIGSIAYGQDSQGNIARCGGYGAFASDEGSAAWLGNEAVQLFYRQCDGRLPAGALQVLMCQSLQISDAFGMLALVERRFSKDRYSTAQLCGILVQAAAMGDASAKRAFKKAAQRLADMACGVRRQLGVLSDSCMQVSYSGSVFAAGEVILTPLENILKEFNFELIPPNSTMLAEGALKLAVKLSNI